MSKPSRKELRAEIGDLRCQLAKCAATNAGLRRQLDRLENAPAPAPSTFEQTADVIRERYDRLMERIGL